MKKILGAVLLSALIFTGCLKDNNEAYKEIENVLPGMNLYDYARTQNALAMQPANAGIRLAILLAEAAKQEETDLSKVVDKNNKSVLETLLGKSVRIEGKSDENGLEEGDYKLTFSADEKMYDGFYLKGSLIVKTGSMLLGQTTPTTCWSVEPEESFQVLVQVGSYNPVKQAIFFTDGQTALYANGDGSYSAGLSGIRTNVEDVRRFSDWGGLCRIRPDALSLAYSDCSGKEFTVTMNMNGPTIYSLTNSQTTETKMSYVVSEGKYILSGKGFTGTIVCKLTGYGDYDVTAYPADQVTVVWSYNGKSFSSVLRYNGYVYPKQ